MAQWRRSTSSIISKTIVYTNTGDTMRHSSHGNAETSARLMVVLVQVAQQRNAPSKKRAKKYIYAAIQPSILLQQQKKTRRKYLGRNHKTLFLGRKAKRSFFLRNRKGCALLFYNSRNKTSCAPYRPKRKKKKKLNLVQYRPALWESMRFSCSTFFCIFFALLLLKNLDMLFFVHRRHITLWQIFFRHEPP